MRRPDFIAKQSAHPSGMFGRFLFWVMAAETKGVNQRTLEFLAPETTSHLLEVGFGHGRTLVTAATSAPGGFVAGIDTPQTWFDSSEFTIEGALLTA